MRRFRSKLLLGTICCLVVGSVGTWLLVASKAATPTATFEAEDGTSAPVVSVVSDAAASGGQAVRFGGSQNGFAGPPYYFGSLVTSTSRATSEAPTMKLAMVEMNWSRAQPDGAGSFDDAYIASIQSQVTAFRNAGREVVLGFGFHYSPQWVLDLSQMTNQNGAASAKANMIFSQAVRTAVNNYIQHVDTIVPLENIWAVRVNTTGGQGEIQYPDSNYWAFSTGAQNGADKPTRLAANPLPGWKPGLGDVTKTTAQVEQWAMWYQGAIANTLDEQIDTIRSTGFHGYYQLISAGAGERPSTWTNDINNKLQGPSLIGRGVAWDKLYSQLVNKKNVVAYSSSAAEASNYNACTPADKSVAITSSATNSWSSARWLARVADEYGFLKSGENPGYNDASQTSADYYKDQTADGMMARAIELTKTCNYLAFFWAHDGQLWASPEVIPYSYYASLINQANNNNNPKPPFPN